MCASSHIQEDGPRAEFAFLMQKFKLLPYIKRFQWPEDPSLSGAVAKFFGNLTEITPKNPRVGFVPLEVAVG